MNERNVEINSEKCTHMTSMLFLNGNNIANNNDVQILVYISNHRLKRKYHVKAKRQQVDLKPKDSLG